MLPLLKKLFGFSGVTETALKVIEKVTGTNDTPQEQRQFILDWLNATKHQSPMRRIIACTVTATWLLVILVWLVCTVVARFFYEDLVNPASLVAQDMMVFMSDNIVEPFNLIIIFYFSVHAINNIRK